MYPVFIIQRLDDVLLFLKYYLPLCRIEEKECNYPPVFRRWFSAQSLEIARKCVEPPAKKKPKDPPFVLKPSMEPVVSFLIEEAHIYVEMECKVCGKKAFPEDPKVSTRLFVLIIELP